MEYYVSELSKVDTSKPVTFKVAGSGETKWLNLNDESRKALINWLNQGQTITPQRLNDFFNQWGINIQGVCNEADISKQYLNRCRKEGVLPGEKVMEKLLPILIKYGF